VDRTQNRNSDAIGYLDVTYAAIRIDGERGPILDSDVGIDQDLAGTKLLRDRVIAQACKQLVNARVAKDPDRACFVIIF
jgi:hypothetical protein